MIDMSDGGGAEALVEHELKFEAPYPTPEQLKAILTAYPAETIKQDNVFANVYKILGVCDLTLAIDRSGKRDAVKTIHTHIDLETFAIDKLQQLERFLAQRDLKFQPFSTHISPKAYDPFEL